MSYEQAVDYVLIVLWAKYPGQERKGKNKKLWWEEIVQLKTALCTVVASPILPVVNRRRTGLDPAWLRVSCFHFIFDSIFRKERKSAAVFYAVLLLNNHVPLVVPMQFVVLAIQLIILLAVEVNGEPLDHFSIVSQRIAGKTERFLIETHF